MTPSAIKKRLFVMALLVCVCWFALIHLTNSGRSEYYEKLEKKLIQEKPLQIGVQLGVTTQLHGTPSESTTLGEESVFIEPAYQSSEEDSSPEDNTLQFLLKMRDNYPNIPVDFWYENFYKTPANQTLCVQYPSILELKTYQGNWQTFENRDTVFQLLAAYYDDRPMVENGPVVRLLAMVNQIKEEFPRTFCHMWFADNSMAPLAVPVSDFEPIWYKSWGSRKDALYPHLLTCHLSERHRGLKPQAVSLSNAACSQASNNLRVIDNRLPEGEKKHEFGVCVKNLQFPNDISGQLVEWLELMRLLGVHKVFVYVLDVHPNVQRVLDFYEENGFIESSRIATLPVEEGNKKSDVFKRLNEVINYNDCFYRNLQSYEFLAGIDIDEVIMPLGDLRTWHDILARFQDTPHNCTKGFPDLCFQNVYFPIDDDDEKDDRKGKPADDEELEKLDNFHFLSHIQRFPELTDVNRATKCFHNTSSAVALHNHFSLSWLQPSCRPISVEPEVAQMQHYRKIEDQMPPLVEDANIMRFKEKLIEQVRAMRVAIQEPRQRRASFRQPSSTRL